jgi:hypothetical protein
MCAFSGKVTIATDGRAFPVSRLSFCAEFRHSRLVVLLLDSSVMQGDSCCELC